MPPLDSVRIAVLIPCYNEASTIESVVHDFRAALPDASIYVFDNNSSDATGDLAREAGAIVGRVTDRGKGNVIRRMFADIDADVYLLVDGDGTYDASEAPTLVKKLLADGLDMIVATRQTEEREAYRLGHRLGNLVLTQCVGLIFGRTFTDMLSGYRVFSRRYVKSFPAHAKRFETETELTIHALELRMPVAEVTTIYRSRPEGSFSKLSTYGDGLRILSMIVKPFRVERPLLFYAVGFFVCVLLALILAIPLFATFVETGLVPRFPTAVLCTALTLLGTILLVCGIVLDAVTHGRSEIKRLAYLAFEAPYSRIDRDHP